MLEAMVIYSMHLNEAISYPLSSEKLNPKMIMRSYLIPKAG
jgi:hypothetical protein